MEIDVSIERIANGYVVTENGDVKAKTYYESLEAFANARIIEELREIGKKIHHSHTPDKPFTFTLKSDLSL